MLESKYVEILKKGKRIDWYGTQVPEELLTPLVVTMANQIIEGINKFEAENEVKNPDKKAYIQSLWDTIRSLPYRLNGDFYETRKKEVYEQLESEKKSKKVKPKTEDKRIKIPKQEKVEEKPKKSTKNSSLIFGNKNNKTINT